MFFNIWKKNYLVKQAQELGDYLKKKLQQIDSPFIQEIRGTGLMIGVQIQSPDPLITSAERTDEILEKVKDVGYLIGKNGLNRDVLALQPPLVITKEDIDSFLACLEKVL